MRPAGMPQTWTWFLAETVSSPEMTRSSSCCPLPETPAIPTISPLRTSRWTSLRSVPKGSSEDSESPSSFSRISPPEAGSPCWQTGRSSPIIMRAMDWGVSWAGLQVPMTLPPRSTVAVWQSSWISSSLWLM